MTRSPRQWGDSDRRAAVFLLVAAGVLWIPIVQQLAGRGRFLTALGFWSGPRSPALGWGVALAVAAIYIAFAVRKIPMVKSHWLHPSSLKLLAVVAAVGAGAVEEAFFRREVIGWVEGLGGNVTLQVAISALAFGLAHGIWGLVTRDVALGARVALATTLLGLALAITYLASGRSLAPVITAHFLITASIQPGITVAAFRRGL